MPVHNDFYEIFFPEVINWKSLYIGKLTAKNYIHILYKIRKVALVFMSELLRLSFYGTTHTV